MKPEKILSEETKKQTSSLHSRESVKSKSDDTILGLNSRELQVKNGNRLNDNAEENNITNNGVNLTKAYVIFTFIVAFCIFIFAASVNPDVFRLEETTSKILNQAVNAIVLLVIPFLFGAVGGLTRIILTDMKIAQKGMLIISSGLMAIFSWVALKSDLLFTSHVASFQTQELTQLADMFETSSFYSSSLIAIVVGMLSANFYIAVLSRVELQLAKVINENYEASMNGRMKKGLTSTTSMMNR